MSLKAYAPGTLVVVKIGSYAGMITAVTLRFGKALIYEITYDSNGKLETANIFEEEFTVTDKSKKVPIGFHQS